MRWEETVNHHGAPFRIAISPDSDENYEKLILIDHLPHNDLGGGSFSDPKPYAFNITIPDIYWWGIYKKN